MLVAVRSNRFLWRLLTPVTVALCSALAAHTLANVLSEQAFPEATAALAPLPVSEPDHEPIVRSKDGERLVARSMFCSDCLPGDEDSVLDVSPGARTLLPLRLIATNISTMDSESFASVLNTSSQRQGAYGVGQNIPEAGLVQAIGHDYLEFLPPGGTSVERVQFDTGALQASIPQRRAASAGSALSLADEYVRAVSDTHFEVDRKLVAKLQGNPLLGGARAQPVNADGKMRGVRLFAVRSKGLASSMGLESGDTILAANGVKLDSLESGLELMGQIKTKDHWNIEIERDGKPVQLQVDLQ